MYEPKYRLNKKDAARWNELLVRHCLELPSKTGGKVKLNPKYPPLSAEENVEFERLSRKRSKKIQSHPKVRASIENGRRLTRRFDYLSKKLDSLVDALNRRKNSGHPSPALAEKIKGVERLLRRQSVVKI